MERKSQNYYNVRSSVHMLTQPRVTRSGKRLLNLGYRYGFSAGGFQITSQVVEDRGFPNNE